MTKNGSSAHKARVRVHAARTGQTYREAARVTEDERTQRIERWRDGARSSGEFAAERERYLGYLFDSDLPDLVKVCLYVLTDCLGTGHCIDSQVVRCTMGELAEATGLDIEAACTSVYLAEAHGWITGFHDGEARMSVPGEEVGMYERFLEDAYRPVRDPDLYQRLQEKIAAETTEHEGSRIAFQLRWSTAFPAE